MEAKLKALKVVDLKELLNRASVSIPSKSNKNDLIARVLASPAALDAYNAQYSPKPSKTTPETPVAQQEQSPQAETLSEPPTQPAPPAASSAQSPSATPGQAVTPSNVKPLSAVAPASSAVAATKPSSSVTETSNSKSAEDEELEKRKARAARFGLPLVPPSKPSVGAAKIDKSPKLTAATPDDADKLAARAARFGIDQAAITAQPATRSNGRKRNAPPVEAVDAEELERRRKRAERFGIPVVGMKA